MSQHSTVTNLKGGGEWGIGRWGDGEMGRWGDEGDEGVGEE
ncbi:hypothetical protein [Nostoc linckia]|nr:hypothetical protein [Nostoc linckia]